MNYHDPFVSNAQWNGTVASSSKLTEKTIKDADLVLITTDHTNIPYETVVKHSKVILDTRNVLKNFTGRKNIVRL